MLKALRELEYQKLCGIDPSSACVENTRRLGIEAYQGSLFQPFKEHAYDCIILSHTLEHIHDIQSALNWIETNLKTGGTIYMETPDASRYADFIYAPLQDFNTEHINHFSLTCLKNLMNEHGFIFMEGEAKTLVTGPQIFYPAIYGFWKQNNKSKYNLIKDEDLRIAIDEYIRRSNELLARIDARLQETLTRSTGIIVWGTGQLALKLLVETSLANANIISFVDNNPINQGKSIRGVPIIAPSQIPDSETPILITTLLHHQAIARQIKDMGLRNEIVFLME